MAFTSFKFLEFLVLTVLVYFIIPQKYRWLVLLVSSYAFYLLSSPKTFIFVLITTVTTFYGAKAIGAKDARMKAHIAANKEKLDRAAKKEIKAATQKEKKKILLLIVLLNFGILAFLKYFRVYINDIAVMMGIENVFNAGMLIPLGISFYTFQSVGYVIDVYRSIDKPDDNLLKYALFVSFFPQIIQGPISKHNQLASQLYEGHPFDYTRVKFGAQLILWGFFKKLVIADRIGIIVNELFDNYTEYRGFFMIIAAVGYTIQIYGDFSGGIDIARGVAEIFGITLTNNFERPYFSRSVREFWQRWHITLGTWCRDYIFYPISLSPTFGQISKKSRKLLGEKTGKLLPVIIAQLATFTTIGIWHGANFKFIAYGLYQAIFIVGSLVFESQLNGMKRILRVNEDTYSWKFFQMVRTFAFVSFGRFFSRAATFGAATAMMKRCFVFNPRVFFDGSLFQLGLTERDYVLLGFCLLFWIVISILQENGIHIRETLSKQNLAFRWFIYILGFMAVLIFGIYGPGYDASTFIYRGF